MKTKIYGPQEFRSKSLTCGCCSAYFSTWPGYRDQDQDTGWGICRSCQADAIHRERREQDNIFGKIRGAMNRFNKARWDLMPRWEKFYIYEGMVKEGLITWTIGRNKTQVL